MTYLRTFALSALAFASTNCGSLHMPGHSTAAGAASTGGSDSSASASSESATGPATQSAVSHGDWGSPAISEAEQRTLLGSRDPDDDFLECCGIDMKNHKVTINRKMRQAWEHDIAEANATGADAEMARYVRSCRITTPARFEIDIAVQIDSQGNHAPYGEFMEYFSDACGNPPSPSNIALLQKVKVVHFYLLDLNEQKQNRFFKIDLDQGTGIMRVGTYRDVQQVIGAWDQWLDGQPG